MFRSFINLLPTLPTNSFLSVDSSASEKLPSKGIHKISLIAIGMFAVAGAALYLRDVYFAKKTLSPKKTVSDKKIIDNLIELLVKKDFTTLGGPLRQTRSISLNGEPVAMNIAQIKYFKAQVKKNALAVEKKEYDERRACYMMLHRHFRTANDPAEFKTRYFRMRREMLGALRDYPQHNWKFVMSNHFSAASLHTTGRLANRLYIKPQGH